MRARERSVVTILLCAAVLIPAGAIAQRAKQQPPLAIQEQGSFAVGGKVITNAGTFNPKQPAPEGQTLHGDHAYVFYQIPVSRRKLPLVFLHGAVLENLGNDSRRQGGLPNDISSAALSRLPDRSAAPRQCGSQYGLRDDQRYTR